MGCFNDIWMECLSRKTCIKTSKRIVGGSNMQKRTFEKVTQKFDNLQEIALLYEAELRDLKSLLAMDITENICDEEEITNEKYSDFVKENILKAYKMLIDYIASDDVEDEEEYCNLRDELSKLQIAIPEEIFEKIEKCVDDFLDPIIYDYENFFAELYTEDFGYFDEDHVFHMKSEAAIRAQAELYHERIWDIQCQIKEFGMKELYPILVA